MTAEGIPSREAAPLTGLPLVKKENLYANMRFPQADLAILMFTLNAIMQDPEPERLLKEFLDCRLSENETEHLLERANRAHAAFVKEEYMPKLTSARIENLWIHAQNRTILIIKSLRMFGPKMADGKFVLNGALPIHMMRTILKAGVDAFKSDELAPLLQQYRESFRAYKPISGGSAQSHAIRQQVYAVVKQRVRTAIEADKKINERQARILFNSLTSETFI